MKHILIFSILILGFNLSTPFTVFGQNEPPAVSMPNDDNVKLINELVEVTNFKNVFKAYCVWRISTTAKENNWSTEKVSEITKSIDFKSFEWHVHNALSNHSEQELKNAIELYKKDPEKSKMQNIIVASNLIKRNLEDFSNELIRGSYVMPDKE